MPIYFCRSERKRKFNHPLCLESVTELCSAVIVLDSSRLWFSPKTFFLCERWFILSSRIKNYSNLNWSNGLILTWIFHSWIKTSLNKLHILELAREWKFCFLSLFQESIVLKLFILVFFVLFSTLSPPKKPQTSNKLTLQYFHKMKYIWRIHLQTNKNKQQNPSVFTHFFLEKWHRDFDLGLRYFLS